MPIGSSLISTFSISAVASDTNLLAIWELDDGFAEKNNEIDLPAVDFTFFAAAWLFRGLSFFGLNVFFTFTSSCLVLGADSDFNSVFTSTFGLATGAADLATGAVAGATECGFWPSLLSRFSLCSRKVMLKQIQKTQLANTERLFHYLILSHRSSHHLLLVGWFFCYVQPSIVCRFNFDAVQRFGELGTKSLYSVQFFFGNHLNSGFKKIYFDFKTNTCNRKLTVITQFPFKSTPRIK